tara:strand:+ start:630 stop:1034 length:405 start_codon:yes stop_codon:yes gene_type:complete
MESIGSFAENLLKEGKVSSGHRVRAEELDPTVPDVTEIEVPSDFVNSLTEGTQTEDRLNTPSTTEVNMFGNEVQVTNELLQRFQDLLVEARVIIKEMTTVGGLGTGPSKKVGKVRPPKRQECISHIKDRLRGKP